MRTGLADREGRRIPVKIDDAGAVFSSETGEELHDVRWLPVTSGAVYGLALNYKGLLESRLAEFSQPPYQKPPVEAVLFVKTPNTYSAHECPIVYPKGVERIQAGPALAIVIGKDALRVTREDALDYVGGFTVANEVCLPEESYYRPAVKAKCRDGFCPIGPWVVDAHGIDFDNLTVSVRVNGVLKQEDSTRNLIRSIPQIIEELSEFMHLKAGDVILTGTPGGRADIAVGDVVEVTVEQVGTLTNTVVAE